MYNPCVPCSGERRVGALTTHHGKGFGRYHPHVRENGVLARRPEGTSTGRLFGPRRPMLVRDKVIWDWLYHRGPCPPRGQFFLRSFVAPSFLARPRLARAIHHHQRTKEQESTLNRPSVHGTRHTSRRAKCMAGVDCAEKDSHIKRKSM